MEIWKPIKQYEGLYEVSNLGRVKSLARKISGKSHGQITEYDRPEFIMKQFYNKETGYRTVGLSKNGIRTTHAVHVLVAKMFCEKPDMTDRLTVNHKNGRKLDNRANNLEWVTYSENNIHALNTGLRGISPKAYKIKCVELNKIFESCECAGRYILNHSSIQANIRTVVGNIRACAKVNSKRKQTNQKLRTAYKYHWEFN